MFFSYQIFKNNQDLTNLSYIAILLELFWFSIAMASTQKTEMDERSEKVKEFSERLYQKGYNDDLISFIIESNRGLDDRRKKLKSEKNGKFYRMFTTIYLSLLLFFIKEIWTITSNKITDKTLFILFVVVLFTIIIRILIHYSNDYTEEVSNKIYILERGLTEVLIYRKKDNLRS